MCWLSTEALRAGYVGCCGDWAKQVSHEIGCSTDALRFEENHKHYNKIGFSSMLKMGALACFAQGFQKDVA